MVIKPNWTVPAAITAFTTTRTIDCSDRDTFQTQWTQDKAPIWLNQVHGSVCVRVDESSHREADAAYTQQKLCPLVIRTADCFPVLLCDKNGIEIAAVHAGWRSAVSGILENTLQQFQTKPSDIQAWIGPGICAKCYEVGDCVYNACMQQYAAFVPQTLIAHINKWHFDLALWIQLVLQNLGVCEIYHARQCTFEDKAHYYSYRRDADIGRMATVIYLNEEGYIDAE